MQKKQTKKDYFAPLLAENVYHVFNRTNNREPLFLTEKFRLFFLERYNMYLLPFVDTYAYCLMDNHFHLMIRVKSEDEIIRYIKSLAEKRRTAAQKKIFLEGCDEVNLHRVIERQFTRLFTSYAMRFNGFFNRNGNLFHRPFKRVVITSEAHFTFLIYYINANPLKHGLLEDFRNYRWSSYQSILSDGYTHLKRKEILEWFGGRDAFKAYHDLGERYWKENADYLLIE